MISAIDFPTKKQINGCSCRQLAFIAQVLWPSVLASTCRARTVFKGRCNFFGAYTEADVLCNRECARCMMHGLRLVSIASIYSRILVWLADRLSLMPNLSWVKMCTSFLIFTSRLRLVLRQRSKCQASIRQTSNHWSSICQWPSFHGFQWVFIGYSVFLRFSQVLSKVSKASDRDRTQHLIFFRLGAEFVRKCWAVMLGVVTGEWVSASDLLNVSESPCR